MNNEPKKPGQALINSGIIVALIGFLLLLMFAFGAGAEGKAPIFQLILLIVGGLLVFFGYTKRRNS
ncbi:hypothetical protein [Rothia amarae]|uniref:hypothetical protein n=1 Tax=Rothia amarae TaxID=169480 RepID=UPI0031DF1B58